MESFARAILAIVVAAAATSATVDGTFALRGQSAKTVAQATVTHESGNHVHLSIVERKDATAAPLRAFDIDMTQEMHLIAISDDFRTFMHVHPFFDPNTGTFSQTLTLDPSHAYTLFADTQPKGIGQQVFRFAIPAQASATATAQPLPASTPSPAKLTVGPYAVALSKTTLVANAPGALQIEIARGGKPAADLHPYLGAAGHAVFVDTTTLDYIHVHPMVRGAKHHDMDGMAMPMNDEHGMNVAGPHLQMTVPTLAVGTYKLWFQFRGGSTLYVAPFTIAVK